MIILGISAFYHDSAAALIKDGEILAAAQEERFTRLKHDPSYPTQAIQFCLKRAAIEPDHIDAIVFYEKPFLKFERLIETYLAFAPKGLKSFAMSMSHWLKDKLFQKKALLLDLENAGFDFKKTKDKIFFSDHHLSHAASAFYPSPFKEALVLTMDGVGEWTTTSVYRGQDNDLTPLKEIHFPHSLGLLYSAFTYYCGFKVNSGEYKLMGLAPYGKPIYKERILKNLIDIKDDGSYRLNMKYFDYCVGFTMTNNQFNELFENNFRTPEQELKQVHMDLAASIQSVLEEVVLKISRSLKAQYQISNLCLAGGVALNCVANAALYRQNIFENIWVQPAAGDAGGALGAALAYYHKEQKSKRQINLTDSMKGAYLGPKYSAEEINKCLIDKKAQYEKLNHDQILEKTAQELANGKTIGWFQGAMEFGPRALGNRSILANPQIHGMQKKLNLKVKFRESFRPFAPAVLAENVEEWFEYDTSSPYMLMTAFVQKNKRREIPAEKKNLFGIDLLNIERSEISAVTHVDYSARLQTVHKETNPIFHNLITRFKKLTGCPVLINTSFNIRGEPIVCTPEDALRCFMGTELDILVLEDFILYKDQQPPALRQNYQNLFALD